MSIRGVLFVVVLAALAGCSRAPREKAWLSMSTFASVSTALGDADRIDEAQKITSDEFARLEHMWSDYRPGSEVSRLNASSGKAVAVSEETKGLIMSSLDYSRKTMGCFDATVGPLVDLWGIGSGREFRIPDEKEIAGRMALCGWENVEVTDDGALQLKVKGMRFDPGGIAKGLAVDICSEKLQKDGYRNFMVNLGGNMRCFGMGRKGRLWRVGVRDPFDKSEMLGVLKLTGGAAVATSGNYERYVVKDNRRYTHIIDPRSGRPVEGMAGVTVVAQTGVDADALSTALFVAGIKDGAAILEAFPGVEAIFVPDIKPVELHVTAGMLAYFTPNKDVTVKVIGR